MTLLASKALFFVLSSPPAVLDFCGGCAVPCLLSLALGWVHFWAAVFTAPVRCEVCSLGCLSWFVLLFMSLLSFTCSCGGVVWSQVCGPSCCSCVLGSCEVSVAPLCRLGLWSLPLLLLFSFGVCSDLGWWAAVLPGLELSFPCPGCFRLAVPSVCLSRLLEFS